MKKGGGEGDGRKERRHSEKVEGREKIKKQN